MTENSETESPVENINMEPSDRLLDNDQKDDDLSKCLSTIRLEKEEEKEEEEEEEDCCPICLENLNEKIGSPEKCSNHFFCLECICQWSKERTTCPLDREPFTRIQLYEKIGVKIHRSYDDSHNPCDIEVENSNNNSDVDMSAVWASIMRRTAEIEILERRLLAAHGIPYPSYEEIEEL
ncbi:hypothetical protein Avbf_08748 [Armadillidium vulgare]|nr:hypothetical protein Avbf_08748 [Armadillidium vulgare]